MRANILGPILAWLAVAVVAGLYLNQRGRWLSLSGPGAYRECFGDQPPENLRVLRSESFRLARYTGELLKMECYVMAEGGIDTSGPAWQGARGLRDMEALQAYLRDRGLDRAPEWFRLPEGAGPAKAMESDGGRLFSIYPAGEGSVLIGGGWRTRER